MAVRESRAPSAPLSMTGAGTCVVDVPAGRFEAEARSVNHRFLKVSLHLGPSLSSLETGIEERVRGKVERGHVTVTLRYTRSSKAAVASFRIDEDVAKAAAKRLKALAKSCGVEGGLTLRDLLTVPGVVVEAGGEGLEAPASRRPRRRRSTARSTRCSPRARPKAATSRASAARSWPASRAWSPSSRRWRPELPRTYRDRLPARIATLLEGSGRRARPRARSRARSRPSPTAATSPRSSRGSSGHLEHAEELLAEGGAVGRKLDFLVQEFHREANTLGSKSPGPRDHVAS